jgi:hypothetical protein
MGFPVDIGGVIEKVDDPAYATALGALVWGIREEERGFFGAGSTFQMSKAVKQVTGWLKSLFP